MIDYYKVLGVKYKATPTEIKSAYRRLAREKHPDVSGDAERAHRDFALISQAYKVLSDAGERPRYDKRLREHLNQPVGSVLRSDNVHARRMRFIAMQGRMNRSIDRWMEEERRENRALQQAVYPTVTFFLATFFAFTLKPRFWDSFQFPGRVILLTLFLLGVWHLASRVRAAFAHYTYQPRPIHDSIIHPEDQPDKPYTRATAWLFLGVGVGLSILVGLVVGEYIRINYTLLLKLPLFFDTNIRPQLAFYPPIAVLIVDTMHTIAMKIDA